MKPSKPAHEMSVADLAAYIDHSVLKPDFSPDACVARSRAASDTDARQSASTRRPPRSRRLCARGPTQACASWSTSRSDAFRASAGSEREERTEDSGEARPCGFPQLEVPSPQEEAVRWLETCVEPVPHGREQGDADGRLAPRQVSSACEATTRLLHSHVEVHTLDPMIRPSQSRGVVSARSTDEHASRSHVPGSCGRRRRSCTGRGDSGRMPWSQKHDFGRTRRVGVRTCTCPRHQRGPMPGNPGGPMQLAESRSSRSHVHGRERRIGSHGEGCSRNRGGGMVATAPHDDTGRRVASDR